MSDMTRHEFIALIGGAGLLLAVKVRRARAAAGGAGDRIPQRAIVPHVGSHGSRLSARFERGWVRRRSERRYRISLGRGTASPRWQPNLFSSRYP